MNAADIQLIAFDLDGTVLNSRKELSPRLVSVLDRARKAGIHIIPATGRQFDAIPRAVKDLASPFIIANNGTQLFTMPEGEKVFEKAFDDAAARALLEEVRQYRAFVFGAYEGSGVFDGKGRGFEEGVSGRIIASRSWNGNYPVGGIDDCILDRGRRLIKLVMIFEDRDERRLAWEHFLPRKDLYVTYFDETNIEIMAAGSNKGAALIDTAARLGVSIKNVIAIGDSDNDKEMLQNAGLGIAMGNAEPAVKALARTTALSCEEDGAAIAIEEALGWQ
jgi:Cof subfamily protein (haloacid dehalogenase superfamily)